MKPHFVQEGRPPRYCQATAAASPEQEQLYNTGTKRCQYYSEGHIGKKPRTQMRRWNALEIET